MSRSDKQNQIKNEVPFGMVAILMSEDDNIAISKNGIVKGTIIKLRDNINRYQRYYSKGHRFSLKDIGKGQPVLQYGYPFGLSTGVRKGQLINKSNVSIYETNYKLQISKIFKNKKHINNTIKDRRYINRSFSGYKRCDERVGTRNYYLIVPTSLCSSDVAVKIAYSFENRVVLKKKYQQLDGIVAAAHTEGCGCNDGEMVARLLLTLKNTILHPNVGGILIVDLGCEKN